MAITSGLFNSINGDRKYDAPWFALYFSTFIGNGVYPNPSTGMQVVEGTNMTTVVKAGKGWIDGYFIVNDSDCVLQHDIADGVLKRIDRVVMRLNYLTRQIEVVIKKGTFASTPVAPTLQRDTDFVELALADVYIANGATQITQANITDQRLNKAVCGIVHGTVDQVDTTTLFNQYQSWMAQQKVAYENDMTAWTNLQKIEFEDWQSAFELTATNWFAQEQADFETWFATLQDLLDENVAATLTAKVQALEIDKANQEDLVNISESVDDLEQTVATHLAQTATRAHLAKNIGIEDASELFTSVDVEGALKEAIEKANSAFTSANDGKVAVANAVTAKGVSASPSDTFSALATKIGQISTGKKWASGTGVTNGNNMITVGGLTFTPSYIIITKKGVGALNSAEITVYTKDADGRYISVSSSSNAVARDIAFLGGYINSNGFSLFFGATPNLNNLAWIAFE